MAVCVRKNVDLYERTKRKLFKIKNGKLQENLQNAETQDLEMVILCGAPDIVQNVRAGRNCERYGFLVYIMMFT